MSELMRPEVRPNEFSYWVNYPEKYKFFSVHFEFKRDVNHIFRRTYCLIDLASDLGGIGVIAFRLFGFIVTIFARLRLETLLINQLF